MQQQQISQDSGRQVDMTIGRIVSVTGARHRLA